jgi:hypothetical protein
MNEKKKAKIVESCLNAVQAGKYSREACYRRFPEIANELETAFELTDVLKREVLSDTEKLAIKEIKTRLMNHLPDRDLGVTKSGHPRYLLHTTERRFAMTWVIIVSTILSILTGTGAVYASTDALPGDALYPLKLFTEDFQLMLAPDAGDAHLYLEFTENRLQEMQRLIEKNRLNDLDEAIDGYQNQTKSMENLMAGIQAQNPDEAQQLRTEIQNQLQEQAQIMQTLMVHKSVANQDRVQEQLQLMLQTNTQTRLRIHAADEEVPEETIPETPTEVAPTMPAEIETESDSDNGEQLRNNAFVNAAGDGQNAAFTFRIANAAQLGVYAEMNGQRYTCTAQDDLVTCNIPQADSSGVLNLYSINNDELLYSYSYDYDWLGTKEPQSQGGSQTQSGSGRGSENGQGGKGGGKGN